MIRSSLYARIAVGFVLLIALVLAVQAVVFLWLVGRREDPNYLELTSRLAAELSHDLQVNPAVNLDNRIARLHPREAVFVIMKDGRVSSARKAPPESIIETVEGHFTRPIDERILRDWVRSQYRGVPVMVNGAVAGVLGVVPLTPIERFGPELAAIGAVLLIVGALIASLVIVGPVRSRIQELRRAAGRLGSGDFTVRAREAGRDEVAELAHAFNAMADELERRATALDASDRARRQLIADVSHELMTPLTAILGHLETLSMTELRLDEAKRVHQIAITTREAKRLERLIGDLLDMARLEAGGGELEIQTIDTRDLFEQVAAHHEHDCRIRNIRFVTAIAGDAETLAVDPFRLEQAVENVTANAIRHTLDGGTIHLGAERAGETIVITVTDSGEGIAPEHLPHIFDRFYKTASAKGMASRGSGLGLSIVKAVVARHGGRVDATSTVGVGTTVRIELPSPATKGSDLDFRPASDVEGRKSRSDPFVAGIVIAAVISTAATVSAQERVTFSEHIAPIVYQRCAPCHRPGGAAPFSLISYDEVRQRATLIARATSTRYMPPWKPDAPSGTFVGERRLTEAQIASFERWAKTGAAEGDRTALPPAAAPTSEWQLGTPDIVISLPQYTLRADGIDVFRNFVVPIPGSGLRYVRGLEFRPGSPAVHHANIRIDYTATGERLDHADPAPGYEGVIPRTADYPDGHFLGWTPGQFPPAAPKGLAWQLGEAGRFVVQLHMRPTGKPEAIAPAIGLFLTDEAPSRLPVMLRLGRQNIDIPAGVSRYVSADEYTLPVDAEIHALQPHSHYRAATVRATATLPDGTTRTLVSIPQWDFGWQDVYRFVTPFWLPAGTRLRTEYVFDNSSANQRNPENPPTRARWGFKSSDEMGDVWIQVMTRSAADRRRLVRDFRPKGAAEEAVGYETQITADPDNPALRDDVALLYLELGKADAAVAQFEEAARLRPDSATAIYNIGTAHEAAGRLGEAAARYEASMRRDATYAPPRVNLGTIRLMQGRPSEALTLYAEAVRLQPDNADARNNLGRLLFAQGQEREALEQLRQAVRVQPSHVAAHFNLASVLLQGEADARGALRHFREASRLRPEWTPPLIATSWILSSHPDQTIRDSSEAIRLADEAVELSNRADASALDALGAAYASASRFEDAVTAASQAAELATRAGAKQQLSEITARLALYQTRRPYVEQVR